MGVEGPTDDPGHQRASRAPDPKLPHHPHLLPGRPHALRRRRGRPLAARQQQRLLSGRRAHLVRLESSIHRAAASWSSHQSSSSCASSHPNLHRRKFFQDRTVKSVRGAEPQIVKDIAWFNTDGNELLRGGLERALEPHPRSHAQRHPLSRSSLTTKVKPVYRR